MRWMVVACCLAWLSCVSFRMPREASMPAGDPNPQAEAAYQLLLQQHTAEKTLMGGLSTHAMVAATLQQPAFAKARMERIGSLRAWPEEKTQEVWAQERQRLEGVTEFFVGLQTSLPKHNDLDMRTSLWQLSLRIGEQVHFPSSIHRLGRSEVEMRNLYPFMGLAWVGYRVQFPIALEPPFGATLVVASALGKAEFFYVASEEGAMVANSK